MKHQDFAFCSVTAALLSACLSIALPTGAAAQNPDLNLKPEQQQAQPPVAVPQAPAVQDETHLLGDWGGFRSTLISYGITLDVDYFFEAAGNVSGGAKQGIGYADQRAIKADIALERLTQIPGLAAHVAILNRAGNDVSAFAIGDRLFSATEIYGGGGDVAVHLAYAYVDDTILDGRVQVAAGRVQVSTAFLSSPIYCDFATLAICGQPRPLPGGNYGFINGAANNWGGFARVRPTVETYVGVGVFDANPTHGGRTGFDWSISKSTGALFPVEIGWEPGGSAGQLPGHYKIGGYYDTSAHNDLYADATGASYVLTGRPARRDNGQIGFWLTADQMLLRHAAGANAGLVGFAGYAHTDGNVSIYQDMLFVGVDDHALIPSRPLDSFGLTFVYAHQSNSLKQTQEVQTALGEPLNGGAVGIETREMIFEAEYSAHLFRGIDLGPDFQYVIRPGATTRYKNATVLGLQGNVKF